MNFNDLPTPVYVIDEDKLIKNLEILKGVSERTGCKILLAQKAFSCYAFYPLIGRYLDGATSSGLYEARLAHEEMRGENHVFCPAYLDGEFVEIAKICDHIVFNSLAQYKKFACRAGGASLGLRINPEFSTQGGGIYDPCAPFSRLGVTKSNFTVTFNLSSPTGISKLICPSPNTNPLIRLFMSIPPSSGIDKLSPRAIL